MIYTKEEFEEAAEKYPRLKERVYEAAEKVTSGCLINCIALVIATKQDAYSMWVSINPIDHHGQYCIQTYVVFYDTPTSLILSEFKTKHPTSVPEQALRLAVLALEALSTFVYRRGEGG